MNHADDEPQAN